METLATIATTVETVVTKETMETIKVTTRALKKMEKKVKRVKMVFPYSRLCSVRQPKVPLLRLPSMQLSLPLCSHHSSE